MKSTEGNFKGVRDANIFYQAWLPDGEVKAALLIVHGLGEYCGRYRNVVEHFVPLGYAAAGACACSWPVPRLTLRSEDLPGFSRSN